MGFLDNMFAGPNGIVRILHESFGTSATIRWIDNRTYHELHDLTVTDTFEETVPFILEKLNSDNTSSQDGSLWENVELLGSIPAAALTRIPRANTDKIIFDEIVYDIVRVVELYAGSTRAAVKIGGKRS